MGPCSRGLAPVVVARMYALILETLMHNTVTDEAATAQAQVVSIGQALAQRIGPEKHRVWFGEASNVALVDGSLRITVANAFTANWIETHYLDQIKSVAESVLGHCPKVTFSIVPAQPRKGPKVSASPRLPDSRSISALMPRA